MFRSLRIRVASLFLISSLALGQTGCVTDIINDVGVPLPGSVPAGTLRAIVAETAFTSFIRGALAYCTDYSGLCSEVDDEIFGAALLARSVTPDNLPILDRQWFSTARVETCQDNIDKGIQAQVYLYLKTTEVTGASSTAADSAVDAKNAGDSMAGAAIFASAAAEDCLDG